MSQERVSYDQYVAKMKARTKGFALPAIDLMRRMPRDDAARVIGRQVLRSATSVGANYCAACRVRTDKEFVAKMRIVCEEADESQYWPSFSSNRACSLPLQFPPSTAK